MVTTSRIQEKFALDSLVRNMIDRVTGRSKPSPKENIIQRIGRIFPKEVIQIILLVLIAFTVVVITSINPGKLRLASNGNQKGNDMINAWTQGVQQAQIAFHSYRNRNMEIYVIDSNGKNLRNLTKHSAKDAYPSWSPNGRKIAFHSDRDGNWEIYITNSDQKNPHRLTNNPADDWYPSWSPDGQKIAFTSNRDGNYEIHIINSDGNNSRNLTNNPRNVTNNPEPDGAPDFNPTVHSVSPTGKLKTIWGWLKCAEK